MVLEESCSIKYQFILYKYKSLFLSRTDTRPLLMFSCYFLQQAQTETPFQHQPTRNYLVLYSPLCLPYRSQIDCGKQTLYAVDHKQGIRGHLLWSRDGLRSCGPASAIGHRETNMVLLTYLSAQPWQAHKISLMSSCLTERIHFKGFVHRGKN